MQFITNAVFFKNKRKINEKVLLYSTLDIYAMNGIQIRAI